MQQKACHPTSGEPVQFPTGVKEVVTLLDTIKVVVSLQPADNSVV
jgi:hypothetical protein